jgi:hypothetical protein
VPPRVLPLPEVQHGSMRGMRGTAGHKTNQNIIVVFVVLHRLAGSSVLDRLT